MMLVLYCPSELTGNYRAEVAIIQHTIHGQTDAMHHLTILLTNKFLVKRGMGETSTGNAGHHSNSVILWVLSAGLALDLSLRFSSPEVVQRRCCR
jgi:hypothetical protein